MCPIACGSTLSLGKVKGFVTRRTAFALHLRYRKLRREAGRGKMLQRGGSNNTWSAEEEGTLLSFVKERKGDEFAKVGHTNILWENLEKER